MAVSSTPRSAYNTHPPIRQLPRYLSGLLLRRLERRGVEVLPHSALKYVGRAMDHELRALNRLPPTPTGGADAAAEDDDGETVAAASLEQPVRVYLTSKFGSLDGSALLTDRVVVAGESGGGGRLPPMRFAGRHGLEADARTGSLVVSHELMASSSVFVAGAFRVGVCVHGRWAARALLFITTAPIDHNVSNHRRRRALPLRGAGPAADGQVGGPRLPLRMGRGYVRPSVLTPPSTHAHRRRSDATFSHSLPTQTTPLQSPRHEYGRARCPLRAAPAVFRLHPPPRRARRLGRGLRRRRGDARLLVAECPGGRWEWWERRWWCWW